MVDPGEGDLRGAPVAGRDGDGGARHRRDRPGDRRLDDRDRGDRVRPVGVAGLAEDDPVADLQGREGDGRAVLGDGGAGRRRSSGSSRSSVSRESLVPSMAVIVMAAAPHPAAEAGPAAPVEAHLGPAVRRRPARLGDPGRLAPGGRDGGASFETLPLPMANPTARTPTTTAPASAAMPRLRPRGRLGAASSAAGVSGVGDRLGLHAGPLDVRLRDVGLLCVLRFLHAMSPWNPPGGWDGGAPGAGRGHPGHSRDV